MANRFWVGGNGTWDNSTTTNWSASSGGGGGASVPTNADTVTFDTASASGNYTVTVASTAVSLSTTVANPTGGTVNLSLSGSPTLCTAAGTLTFTSGTITLNNFTLSTGIFSSSNASTRSIAFGSGSIALTSTTAATVVLDMATATNFTWTGTGGFTRSVSGTSTVQVGSTAGGSSTTAPNLSITGGGSTVSFTSGTWFNNLLFTSGYSGNPNGGSNIVGNLTLSVNSSYVAWTATFVGTSTVICNGKQMATVTVNTTGTITLGDNFGSTSAFTLTAGTFNTTASNYSITVGAITVNGGTLTLNGSTVNLGQNNPFTYNAGTVNIGTSTINLTSLNAVLTSSGFTFYNVAFTSTAINATGVTGSNTFNNLTIAGRTSSGIGTVTFTANQTINGTFTVSAGTNASCRAFIKSNTFNTARTLTCAAFSATDADFQDITIAGAAAPVSGTRLSNCGNNTSITFPSTKTVYWNLAGNNNWSATAWATSAGGVVDANNFPLAQDTAIFTSTSPSTGAVTTVEANWNIGTIDMQARTSNTMTLATGSNTPTIYGNWINGTGTTLTGTGLIPFSGRTTQQITSAGVTFTQGFTINSPSGTVQLVDALTTNRTTSGTVTLTNGTLDLNGKTLTFTGSTSSFVTATGTKNLTFNGGTLVIPASSTTAFNNAVPTGFTTTAGTGTGTISMTGSSAKTFVGGGSTFNCTLNQGGAGILTISSSNTFGDIKSTYAELTGATTIVFPTSTTTVAAFTGKGAPGSLLTLNSSSAGTQGTIALTGGGTVTAPDYLNVQDLSFTPFATNGTAPYKWYAGANSTNSGNNSGILFAAATVTAYLLLSGTSWSTPANWNNGSNTIHMIGGGGGSAGGYASGNNRAGGGGGGGGGYTKLTNQTLSGAITYAIGAAGTAGAANGNGGTGGTTSWNSGASTAGGGGGGRGSSAPSSTGGTAGTGTTFNGGVGGAGSTSTAASTGDGGGGGGGAGGPNGTGGSGGAGFADTANANIAGGGGGGNGGGSNGAAGASAVGGTGGNNFGGTGGGASNTAGTFGGGGGGGAGATAGVGGVGIDVSNTVGGGGGGGGSSGNVGGGNGGVYGAGGGGGGVNNTGSTGAGRVGTQGMIFIIYTAAGGTTATGNFFMLF